LADKATDPAVVCVDEAGRFAVSLCGGHAGGANELARRVAAIIGAEPVITTATDASGLAALDGLTGFVTRGDVAGVTTAWLNGTTPSVSNELGWPLPESLTTSGTGEAVVAVTDRVTADISGRVTLHPPSLVAGVGASTGAPPSEIAALIHRTLAGAGLARDSVAEIATLDRKLREPAIVAMGLPIRAFSADDLARVGVPSPSSVVEAAVGTPSVCEAAALLAAGEGAELIVGKQRSAHGTVAIARRKCPRGYVALVGLGPGAAGHRTPKAELAIRGADVVIGYGPYLTLCADLIRPGQETVTSPIGDEVVRAKQAVTEGAAGRQVAVVCSGDSGVYGMASLVLEIVATEAPGLEVEIVPGVTAAVAVSSRLGAPLGHDHAVISLSDLLTPWDVIERRLRAAASGDFVIALYNPRSNARRWQFDAAMSILLEHRSATTPVGIVTDATRAKEEVSLTTLAALDTDKVGMTTCVVVGSSATLVVAGRMVTPRGFQT
ncbi:MAG TPA: precorrin-3B C(17)-methyltransferase, partial [Acidimicrobiales bacterium]